MLALIPAESALVTVSNSPTPAHDGDPADGSEPLVLIVVGLILGIVVTSLLFMVIGCFWCALHKLKTRYEISGIYQLINSHR